METVVVPALELFRVEDVPIVRVELWSKLLNATVYLVPERTGQNPPDTYEITPQGIAAIERLVESGSSVASATAKVLGLA